MLHAACSVRFDASVRESAQHVLQAEYMQTRERDTRESSMCMQVQTHESAQHMYAGGGTCLTHFFS
jgi:hypothetical protein